MADSFYVPLGDGRWRATAHTTGPWDAGAQHGGPPSALLGRAMERCQPREEMIVARFTCEILGAIPVGEISVEARLARPGRSVEFLEATASAGGREVARASTWRVRRTAGVPVAARIPASAEPPGEPSVLPRGGWVDGYLSAIEWRAVQGSFTAPGPATLWGRMRYPLVPDEEPSPLERVLAIADSGNGASWELDITRWHFINPELTVHLHREAVGEWICLDARTAISAGGAGLATSVLSDLDGPVGVGAQSLLIAPRPAPAGQEGADSAPGPARRALCPDNRPELPFCLLCQGRRWARPVIVKSCRPEAAVSDSDSPRLVSRRLGLRWDLRPADALRLVRADAHPVALLGTWAGGSDVIGSEPVLVRGAPAPPGEVLDAPWPAPVPDETGAAFGGGWIGYLGYSAAGEALPSSGERRLPAWWFGYYDHVLRRDQASGDWFFEALWTAARAGALERRFAELSRRAASQSPRDRPAHAEPGYACGPFRLIPSAEGHKAAVRQTVEYIGQGDIFQANICLRAEAAFDGNPLDAFCQAVTALSPPYAAFISPPGGAVASLSPELFLRRTGGIVVSRPIKGTSYRSARADQATAQRGDLESSAKNRAENVMIVDLVRNDLSRVCEPGSVSAPRLLDPEPHPGVWHLVSEVRGTLIPDATDGDLIRAAFPPGSVTGAPKVRALEVIDELEAAPREVYTGAIGYRSPAAGLELNVAIRTFEFAAGRVWLGCGGGIVADSVPADEYAECLIKASPLISAIGSRLDTADGEPVPAGLTAPRPMAGVFTSLLVTDGETAGLDSHLARLEASTRQVYGKGLPAALPADLAACLARRPTGRLRITVRPVGGPLQARVEVVPLAQGPAAVTLRPTVLPGGLGGHKWLDRRLLADLVRAADIGATPARQLLITDSAGQVLETDRGNVFAVIDGVLRTPPADGRILPGTAREAIVRAARDDGIGCGTESLSLASLREASEVFVSNAVYGVLPVSAIDGCPHSWELGPVTKHFGEVLASRLADRPVSRAPAQEPPGRTLTARGGGARPLVVLVDNYDSFTYNLAHLLITAGCHVEVVRNDEVPAGQVTASGAAGVVISPGPCAPPEAGISVDVVRGCAGQTPLLGICLGHQAIAAAYGAAIVRAPRPVHGQVCEVAHDGRGVLAGLPQGFHATRYHSLIVDEDTLPAELVITARSGRLPMGLRHATAPVEGVQFHPESILTAHGAAIIGNFVRATRRTP